MTYFKRLLKLPKHRHLLLFGARNTGKSTLIRQTFEPQKTFWIDLLNFNDEERYTRDPSLLKAEVLALDPNIQHVVIDEVQKVPKLLDVVHQLIESTHLHFILTGSSARKLRYGGANLLAGRAFVYHLYPFTSLELGQAFNLDNALRWGTLPTIHTLHHDDEKMRFLQAYGQTYLKEEIWMEQFVRKLDPFRKFLEASAQSNGKIINFHNIAQDVGIDDKTVKQYYSILEDTLIGFFLESYQHSFRKRLGQKPKFYYFDTGVARSLCRLSSVPLSPSTSAYGEAFEHFIVLECIRLAHYFFPEFRFSYLKTKDDAEVDLVVERPGEKVLFIEIKSTNQVRESDLTTLMRLAREHGDCEAVCFSQDKLARTYPPITIYPWQSGLYRYFVPPLRQG